MPPHQGKFVAYFRVSTDKQGKSGLGLGGTANEQRIRGTRECGDGAVQERERRRTMASTIRRKPPGERA
jgi:hypothetical protein